MSQGTILMAFGAPLQAVGESVRKSHNFLLGQSSVYTLWKTSTLTPEDPNVDRYSTGIWRGSYTSPVNDQIVPTYSCVRLLEPVLFPMDPAKNADFRGTVDWPFVSMDGFAGNDGTVPSQWPQGGTRIGSFFIIGSVGGTTVFKTKVPANGIWEVHVPAGFPAGDWAFNLVTYANQTDGDADLNRIMIGHGWLESERPGDIRDNYAIHYDTPPLPFLEVSITRGANNTIQGIVLPFNMDVGFTYAILVTQEADVEYAWAIHPLAGNGPFTITRALPLEDKVKLRLIVQKNGAPMYVLGGAWSSINWPTASAPLDYTADLQIEYRSITNLVPLTPDAILPARLNQQWSVDLMPVGTGQVRLVDNNTRRILGEHTMQTGLLRSYNVPATDFSQNLIDGVYYEEFNNTAFLYDQAVALFALIQMGEWDHASRLVTSLVNSQNPDGSYPFAVNQAAVEQQTQDFIRNGAVAWVLKALLLADKPEYAGRWSVAVRPAAERTLAFLMSYRNALGLIQGGRGNPGDPGFVVPWWSCEHNIDCWWCFNNAYIQYGDPAYKSVADMIQLRLLTNGIGWDPSQNIFWQGGTVTAGVNTPDGMHALDVMSWGGVLLGKWGYTDRQTFAYERAYRLYYCTDDPSGWSGFTTFVPEDGYPPGTIISPWYEGSYGMAYALKYTDVLRSNGLMRTLAYAQNPDGSYNYALEGDPVQGIGTFPSVIGAAWNVVAYSGPGTPYKQLLWV